MRLLTIANWFFLPITIVLSFILVFKVSIVYALYFFILISIIHSIVEWLARWLMKITTTETEVTIYFLTNYETLSIKDSIILGIAGVLNVFAKIYLIYLFLFVLR